MKTTKKSMTMKIVSIMLSIIMIAGIVPVSVFATEPADTAEYVYISVSYDDKFIEDKNGKPIAYVPVSFEALATVDLNAYNLSEYLYDEDGDGTYEITALQLIIYAHEALYGGDFSEVTFTGSPGSSYFAGGIFGQDENLNYYLNGQYPLAGEGWGATSDQIVLEAGDVISLAGFTSWDFYQDSGYGFHYFADDEGNMTHAYTATAGEACSIKLIKGTKDYEYNSVFFDVPDYTVHYGTELYSETGSVTTDANACASITFPSAGTWYLWADGGYGVEYPDSIVSAPGYAEVTVTEPASSDEPLEGTVYISASHDEQFINDKNGSPLAYVGVELNDLTDIDLDDYSLGDYKYDEDGDGEYEITLLHLYIYVHEVICDRDWSEVGISGGAGSIYFAGGLFGFEDENLRYNYNGAYPANEDGWGFTADQIVLSDGDFIEVAHFSDWYFYGDSAYGFHYFTDANDEIDLFYTAQTGTEFSVKLIRVGGGLGTGDTTTAEAGYTVYYGSSIGNAIDSVTTDDDGVASITFYNPGTYYVWCKGGLGSDMSPDAIVSSPASATVTVTGEAVIPEQPDTPEEKTDIKVTIDEGMNFNASAYCCDDCYTELFYSGDEPVTSVNTTIEKWECEFHGKNPPAEYKVNNIAVSAPNNADYIVKGATINGNYYAFGEAEGSSETYTVGTYTVRMNKNQWGADIYASNYEDGIPEDITIHIHIEAKRVAQDVSEVLDATLAQLAATVTAPTFGTDAGEWTVLCLARGGYFAKDNAYFTDYYNRIVATVNETAASVNMNGALHKNKSTENSRLIVALSAIGKDATAVGDWNLVEAYSANGFDWIKKQGINGTIWALIALDSNSYATSDATIRQQCVDAILAAQHDDGGWALQANKTYASDPDVTGMALQALYPYRDQEAVAEACEKAFTCLSEMQHENGTFASGGSECSESCAWVIVACTTWGINPDTDSRFIKNGNSVVDALLTHYLEESDTFEHIVGAGSNGMATDQSCYALVAYDRLLSEKPALFDCSDVTFEAVTPPVVSDFSASLGLPENVENVPGTTFNGVVSVNSWDNEAGYKLIDLIVDVPAGLSVTNVTAGNRLAGGALSYNLAEGKLRIVYFDANENSDLTTSGNSFPVELFNITFSVENVTVGNTLDIAISEMSLKLTSDSTNEDSKVDITTEDAEGSVTVVEGRTFSAGVLYQGDGVDLIPADKKAVVITVTQLEGTKKLTFNDGTTTVEFKYNAEISEKMGVTAYIALVDADMDMDAFENAENFTIDEADADSITFGDINGDGVINAQDALAAVDMWLRKGDAPADDDILTANVNGDGRIDTYDALGIVEAFVYDDREYVVVTKATTIFD